MGFENLGRTRMPPKTRHPVKTCWHCRKKASNLSRSVFEAFSINWVSRLKGSMSGYGIIGGCYGGGQEWDLTSFCNGRQAGREHSDSLPQID